ncbi:MAG: diacylglycerol/lipid kinase family protein [Terriglobia bacterium]
MNSNRRIAVILNPRAAGGRTGKRWPEVARALEQRLGPVTVRFTERPGHATLLARELLKSGFDLIAGAGGDGTFNEIANGMLEADEPARPGACLGIIPAGTGGDFQRMFFPAPNLTDALETLATGEPYEIDVGKVAYDTPQGVHGERYFVNLVSFGMGGAVAAGARNFLSPLGGRAAFLWSTFRVLLTYRGRGVKLIVNGSGIESPFFITNVAVGNGRFHGGGMFPCPTAVLNDGVLEVTVIEYMNMFRLLRDIHYLYSGRIYSHPKIHHLRATHLDAAAQMSTWIEVDGEPLGKLPVTITVLPRRLPVMISGALAKSWAAAAAPPS